MFIKNITDNRNFNLESGECKPGSIAEASFSESKLLLGQGFAEVASDEAEEPPAPTAPTAEEPPAPTAPKAKAPGKGKAKPDFS